MSMMTVPTLQSGERSLPAELRTRRGRHFAQRRLLNGMRGVCGIGDGEGDGEVFTPPVSFDPGTGGSGTLDFPFISGDGGAGGTLTDGVLQTGSAIPYTAPSGIATTFPLGQTPPAAPSGYQWVTAANSLSQNLAKILSISQGGTVMQLPNGQQVISGSPGANVGLLSASGAVGSVSAYLPYLLLAGGAMLLFSMVGGRGR